VTFDPFGDFATRGYLRNVAGEKDRAIVRQMEHAAFTTGLDAAFEALTKRKTDLRGRTCDASNPVRAGLFLGGRRSREDGTRSRDQQGRGWQPRSLCRSRRHSPLGRLRIEARPGQSGHGGEAGRSHGVPCIRSSLPRRQRPHHHGGAQRSCAPRGHTGIRIDWASTDKDGYLAALTRELQDPGKGHLDAYLKPFVRKSEAEGDLPANVAAARGLHGEDSDVVLGATDDETLKAEYEAQKRKRKEALG